MLPPSRRSTLFPYTTLFRSKLRGPAVVIRRAKPNEKIVTLDGVARALTPEMTAICDAERPTIVAGERTSHRSEEHTSELQSHSDLVCRLLLEKKKCQNTPKR